MYYHNQNKIVHILLSLHYYNNMHFIHQNLILETHILQM